jgi:D-alanyl-D-alanine carboxypeptidase
MKIVKHILLILTATGLMLVSHTAMARHAALLIDADNGNVLYELEANQSWYPASLTKLMTLYMTFSALESGRLRLSDSMNISSHASRQPTSKLGLKPWDSISVEDAILAIVTRSANDAAVVLAERLAGSEQQFAIKMTSTAHSLGMYGSHFMNATGLPHDWQTTTAHDMALLAWKINRKFPQYYPYFSVDSLYYNGRYFRSTNKFVANYPGAEGMKTGYTCGSGHNLVASANQYGKRLIGVVLGGMTSSERYEQMFTLMDIGFSNEYGSYHSKNIDSMSKNAIGIPPYQLSCGHRPSSHYAARHVEEDDDDRPIHYVRKTSNIARHIASNSRIENTRAVTNIKIVDKTKTVVKHVSEPQHLTHLASTRRTVENVRTSSKTKTVAKQVSKKQDEVKSNNKTVTASKKSDKTVSKTKVATTSSRSGKKALQTVAKSKQPVKSEKAILVAKASSHDKGYYTPTSKDKKTTASATKGKGYYKPDSSNKTVAKSSLKSKRSAKR